MAIVKKSSGNTDLFEMLDSLLEKGVLITSWNSICFKIEIPPFSSLIIAILETYLRYAESIAQTSNSSSKI